MAVNPPEAIGLVLTTLEKAAKTRYTEKLNFSEVFCKEKWTAFQNLELLHSVAPLVDPTSISLIMASAFEIDHIVSMLTSLLSVALEFQENYDRSLSPIITKFSRGIESLPDEILSIIFDFAVRAEGKDGGMQATRLSEVSKRFRGITLSQRDLWTTLSLGLQFPIMKQAYFIARSGPDTHLDVFVDIDPANNFVTTGNEAQFRRILGPTTPRWRSLTLRECDRRYNREECVPVRSYFIRHFFKAVFRGKPKHDIGAVPQLEELYLHGDVDRTNFAQSASSYIIPLTSPNLRFLQCLHYIPSPSTSFSSVTTLIFSFTEGLFHHYHASLTALAIFLASMPRLSNLDLELRNVTSAGMAPTMDRLPTCFCALVTSFRLRIPEIHIRQARQSCITPFLKKLRLPQLKTLMLDIGFVGGSEAEGTNALSDLTFALLRIDDSSGSLAHPSSIKYEIAYNLGGKDSASQATAFPKTFHISLDTIASASILTFVTSNRIAFTRETGSDGWKPTRLSEIKFIGCKDMEIEDFHRTILSLQDANVWSSIKRVVVVDCPRLGHDEVVKIVGDDRLGGLGSRPAWRVRVKD